MTAKPKSVESVVRGLFKCDTDFDGNHDPECVPCCIVCFVAWV